MRDWVSRARELDNRVLGRPVPDRRPYWQRIVLGPWPLWSKQTRWRYGVVMVLMVGSILMSRWLAQPLFGVLGTVGGGILAFLVMAAEGRRQSREASERQEP